MPGQRLYCYVDETGQDTLGEIFLVGVLMVHDKESAVRWATNLNKVKKTMKWHRTRKGNKINFLDAFTKTPYPSQTSITVFRGSKDYFQLTIEGLIESLKVLKEKKLFLFLDGKIHKEIRLKIGATLHHQRIGVKKVRSVSIQKEPLIGIIDAIVGAAREMIEGQREIKARLEVLIKDNRLNIINK